MSVSAAGSAQSAQQAIAALRQVVQAEQVVAATVIEASQQIAQDPSPASKAEGVGENLDVTA